MARVFIDGFEGGDFSCWDGVSDVSKVAVVSSANLQTENADLVDPAYGNYCCVFREASFYNDLSLDVSKFLTPQSTLYLKFRFQHSASTLYSGDILAFYDAAGNMLGNVYLDGDRKVQARMGNWTSLDTSDTTIDQNSWYLIEVYFYVDDTNGRFDIKINGILECTYTGDTRHLTRGPNITNIRLTSSQPVPGANKFCFDDFVIDSDSWIGDSYITGLQLDANDDDHQDWSNDFDEIEEVPPNDDDYIYSSNDGDRSCFTLADAGAEVVTVQSVQVCARVGKVGFPPVSKLELFLRIADTDYDVGVEQEVPTSPDGLLAIWEDNPADSAPFENADLDALAVGVIARA